MSTPIPIMSLEADHNVRNRWAQELAIRGVYRTLGKLKEREKWKDSPNDSPTLRRTPSGLELEPPPSPPKDDGHRVKAGEPLKVAIVGAGAAGLFTGLVFDWLNKQEQAGSAGFHVDYKILEAAATVGGRLFTYNFETGPNGTDKGNHFYYDVGAMRFPDNPVMTRTFQLFKYLGMNKFTLEDNPPVGSLIPYYMKNGPDDKGQEFFRFNDKTLWGDIATINSQAVSHDPFEMNTNGRMLSSVLANKPDDVMNNAIQFFRCALEKGDSTGWDALMTYDQMSTRQYLLGPKYVVQPPPECPDHYPSIPDQPYNAETINWLETFNGGSAWYDQAHSETVLESMDFEYPDHLKPPNSPSDGNIWWCILGGANVLAQNMSSRLENGPKCNVRVTGIDCDTDGMAIWSRPSTSHDAPTSEKYDAVFNSTTLGCMRVMDINANLNYPTKEAMRTLGYGQSAKVGMLFESAWWIHGLEGFDIKKGGLGHSDLTIRTCVYPSYNYNVLPKTRAVLLCSYTWQQDAERIGSLMTSINDPSLLKHEQIIADEAILKDLILRDLAKIHTGNIGNTKSEKDLYVELQNLYVDHYAHDWTHDPNTAGAFAFFRPAQFSTLWPELIQPGSDLVIIGEAASPHHAWVVGALESAVHGVYQWIYMNQQKIGVDAATKAMNILSTPVDDVPFVGLPPYMPISTVQWQGLLAGLVREDYLKEQQEEAEKGENKAKEGKAIHVQ